MAEEGRITQSPILAEGHVLTLDAEVHQECFLFLAAMPLLLAMAVCAGGLAPAKISLDDSSGEALPAETAYRFTLPSVPDGDVSLDSYAGQRDVVLVLSY